MRNIVFEIIDDFYNHFIELSRQGSSTQTIFTDLFHI